MQSKDHKHQLLFSVKVKVAQSCLTLCDPLDDTVHGILQAWILQWVAVPLCKGSSQPRDRTHVSWMAGGFFTNWAKRESQVKLFPLDSEPGPFCVLGEHDNHHTTEISTFISRWYYTHIYLYHHFSQVSGGGVDRCCFAFLKIVAQHHQHLLSLLISHGKIITFRTKINDLIIKIWFF